MRPLVFAVIALSAVILLGGISEVKNAELSAPPDVSTLSWIPLGDSFGFVIVTGVKTAKPGHPAPLALSGYFMVKRKNVWFRLTEEPLPGARGLPLAKK